MHFKYDSSEIRTLTSRIFHVMLFESCIFELGYQNNQKLFSPVLNIFIRKYALTGLASQRQPHTQNKDGIVLRHLEGHAFLRSLIKLHTWIYRRAQK